MKNEHKKCIICDREIRKNMPLFMCCDMYTCSEKCSKTLLEIILEYDSDLSLPDEWKEIKTLPKKLMT